MYVSICKCWNFPHIDDVHLYIYVPHISCHIIPPINVPHIQVLSEYVWINAHTQSGYSPLTNLLSPLTSSILYSTLPCSVPSEADSKDFAMKIVWKVDGLPVRFQGWKRRGLGGVFLTTLAWCCVFGSCCISSQLKLLLGISTCKVPAHTWLWEFCFYLLSLYSLGE